MKTRNLIVAIASLMLLPLTASQAADELTRLHAKSVGSKLRVEGTSPIHDWQLDSKIVGGFIEVSPNFPTEPGQNVKPGKVEARAEIFVTVRSLQSVHKDGSHFDDKMDEVTWEKLKVKEYPKIIFRTSELVLKEVPKSKDAAYVLDSTGELSVAGVTNKASFPVNVFSLGDKKLRITGSVPLKMTDFNIKPETVIGIKTGDDVKVIFEWMVGPPKAPAASGK